jgi:VWFA-related protein
MKRCLLYLALAVFLCGIPALMASDDPPQTKPKEVPEDQKIKVKTELMEVRTVVADKKGGIIENLKKEDFELLENDKPQDISFFSVSRVESRQPPKEAAAVNPAKRALERLGEPPLRSTLLFVDTLHLTFASLNAVKDALRRYVNETLTDQDAVALVTTSSTLGIAQLFTRDRQLLLYGIEQIRVGPVANKSLFTPTLAGRVLKEDNDFGAGSVWKETITDAKGQKQQVTVQADTLARGDAIRLAVDIVRKENNVYCPCSVVRTYARNRALQVLADATYSRKTTLAILKAFAEKMIDLPGKRMIVVFSDGFTLLDSGGDLHTEELESAVSRATRSGVVIYSIDAKGLQGPPTIDASRNTSPNSYSCPGEEYSGADTACLPPNTESLTSTVHISEREETISLYTMAEETGGKLFENSNNINEAMGRAFDANRYYYVLSYYLQPGIDMRKFRSLKVRVRNHPEYTVRTARGFNPVDLIVKIEDAAGKTPQQRLLRAMEAPSPVTDLGVSARAEFVQTEADDKQVSLTVYLDGDRFQYLEKDQRNNFKLEILYVILDGSGKQVDATSAGVEGNLSPERLAQAKTSGYRFSQRLTLKPGVYQARIGVREEGTERVGTATTWISVPELAPDRLEMSDLLLRNPLEPAAAVQEGVEVRELEQVRMVQSIPLYARNDFCDYAFRVHQGALAPADLNLVWMREVLQDGKAVKQESWQPIAEEEKAYDAKGWFDLDGDVELSEFKPGVYELRVSVKDAQSNKTIQRSTVFAVE